MAEILVIDDDEQLLDMVSLALRRLGHDVLLVSNPHEGLELLEEHRPDMLILDVMMPGLSGYDICRKVRAMPHQEGLPIAILTARAQEIDRQTAMSAGANLYLAKPVMSNELGQAIESLLGTAERPSAPSAKSKHGLVISVFGLRGGVGRTTLAVNLALALRFLSNRPVSLADLSPSSGQVTTHLRQKAPRSWIDLPMVEKVNSQSLRANMVVHSSGLQILAAPSEPLWADQPSAGLAGAILETLQSDMLFSVIDLPPVLNAATHTALQRSDLVLHVVNPEFVSVRVAMKANRVLTSADYKGLQRVNVLNQVTEDMLLPQAAVEKGLNERIAFHIGYDPHQPRALAKGLPLPIEPATSPVPIGVRRMAAAIWSRVKAAGLVAVA